MPIANSARAREVLARFSAHIDEYMSYHVPIMSTIWNVDNPAEQSELGRLEKHRHTAEKRILRLQTLVEDIGNQLAPEIGSTEYTKGTYLEGWSKAKMAVERLIGILDNEDVRQETLGPVGPVLSVQQLHPWVWNAAASLWDDGYYQEAIIKVANAIERHTQLKVGRPDLSGKKLYSQLFTCNPEDKRPLIFQGLQAGTEDWTSAHEGAHHYAMGCSQRIRNLVVHGDDMTSEQEGLEYLAALSLLARWIDTAEVRNTN